MAPHSSGNAALPFLRPLTVPLPSKLQRRLQPRAPRTSSAESPRGSQPAPRETAFSAASFQPFFPGCSTSTLAGKGGPAAATVGKELPHPRGSPRKSKAAALQAMRTSAPSAPTSPRTPPEDGGERRADAVLRRGKPSEAAAAFSRQPPRHRAIGQLRGSILLFKGDVLATKTPAANCSEGALRGAKRPTRAGILRGWQGIFIERGSTQ